MQPGTDDDALPPGTLHRPRSGSRRRTPSILVVIGAGPVRTAITGLLSGSGYLVHGAATESAAWKHMQELPPDLVLTDDSTVNDWGWALLVGALPVVLVLGAPEGGIGPPVLGAEGYRHAVLETVTRILPAGMVPRIARGAP